MKQARRVAFLGLGVMGYPMAGHLSAAGHSVLVYNRNAAKAQAWLEAYEGKSATTVAAAVADAEIVFACVGRDEDVLEITQGDAGAFAAMEKGAMFVDHTTTSAGLARKLDADAREQGLRFMDAPVSGGQAGAENGKLTIMVGGSAADFSELDPVLDCYAQKTALMGAASYGQLTKMVNQICIAGLLQGLSEALAFSEAAGLDSAQVIEVISKGAAQSWQMENRYQTMLAGEFDHGFAVDWMRKDLSYVLQQAKELSADLSVTELVDGYYAQVQANGGGRWDTSSLITRLTKDSPGTAKSADA